MATLRWDFPAAPLVVCDQCGPQAFGRQTCRGGNAHRPKLYLSSEMTGGQVTRSRSKFKWWKPAIPAVAISGKNLYMTTLRDVF